MNASSISFESLSPNLIVANVNRSVQFYADVFGFTLVASVPDSGSLNWAMVQRESVTIMFQTLASIQEDVPSLNLKAGSAAMTMYIKVKNMDNLLSGVRGKVPLAVDLRTTFYGAREFAIKDPDGNVLMFAEDSPKEL
ncbi:MAG: VOC family protein [Cyclobacteriaceae bacterium]|nr:VOC family protein [Cyclobacteriaceae bacterium]